MKKTCGLNVYAVVFIASFLGVCPTTAVRGGICDNQGQKALPRFGSYEPNLVGYTDDDNDRSYLDFRVSLKYSLACDFQNRTWQYFLPYPYIAFSGRFAQYIGTRDSSPVVGKRFNPEFSGAIGLESQVIAAIWTLLTATNQMVRV